MNEYTTTEQNCRACDGPCGRCRDAAPEHIDAIRRELAKRATTYPKIIAKKRKQSMPAAQVETLIQAQRHQVQCLEMVLNFLETGLDYCDPPTAEELLKELQRELKMRRTYYPRMVYFKRITEDDAQREILAWANLVAFFTQKYC